VAKGTIDKNEKYGDDWQCFSFVENFLSGRTLQVRVGAALSDMQLLDNGTTQGSVISPLLFLLMINDLLSRIASTEWKHLCSPTTAASISPVKILDVIQHTTSRPCNGFAVLRRVRNCRV